MDKTNSKAKAASQDHSHDLEKESVADEASATALDPLAELKQKLKEAEDKYLYLYADFENYKKRVIKERSDLLKFGWENIARELLTVSDNLCRGLEHAKPENFSALLEGLKLVSGQFSQILAKYGVQEVASEGKTFDPETHDAVAQTPSDAPQGQIVQVEQKGYTLHGRLLRPAKVIVSDGNQRNND